MNGTSSVAGKQQESFNDLHRLWDTMTPNFTNKLALNTQNMCSVVFSLKLFRNDRVMREAISFGEEKEKTDNGQIKFYLMRSDSYRMV